MCIGLVPGAVDQNQSSESPARIRRTGSRQHSGIHQACADTTLKAPERLIFVLSVSSIESNRVVFQPSFNIVESTPDTIETEKIESLVPAPTGSEIAKTLVEATRRVLRRRFRVAILIRNAYEHMESHTEALQAVWTDLKTSLRLLIAWVKRSYTQVSAGSLIVLVAALIYFVTPVDLIPDALATIGFVDDVAAITTAVETARHELDEFRTWEDTESLSS